MYIRAENKERTCQYAGHKFYGKYYSVYDLNGDRISACLDCCCELKRLKVYLGLPEKPHQGIFIGKKVKTCYADYLPHKKTVDEVWKNYLARHSKPYNAV